MIPSTAAPRMSSPLLSRAGICIRFTRKTQYPRYEPLLNSAEYFAGKWIGDRVTTRPMVRVRRSPARAYGAGAIARLLRYLLIFAAVRGFTSGLFCSARETVGCDTWASRAMSLMTVGERIASSRQDVQHPTVPVSSSDIVENIIHIPLSCISQPASLDSL